MKHLLLKAILKLLYIYNKNLKKKFFETMPKYENSK